MIAVKLTISANRTTVWINPTHVVAVVDSGPPNESLVLTTCGVAYCVDGASEKVLALLGFVTLAEKWEAKS